MSTLRSRSLAVGLTSLATVAALTGAANAQASPLPNSGTVQILLKNLVFTAGAGSVNRLHVTSTLDPIVYLHDDNAPIRIGETAVNTCERVDPFSVRCHGLTQVVVSLDEGNDLLEYQGASNLLVLGGNGDDKLSSLSFGGTVAFDGGPGIDTCAGAINAKANCEF